MIGNIGFIGNLLGHEESSRQRSAVSDQPSASASAVSHQPSAISSQQSAISISISSQPSAISCQLSVVKRLLKFAPD